MKTCGDFGGVIQDGGQCTRKAGWGTAEETGPCKAHHEQAAKLRRIKKTFLDLVDSGKHSFRSASKKLGLHETTIWRMRKVDSDFDHMVETSRRAADRFRVEDVEDTLYRRLVKGRATAAEMIFYLVNRAPHRWQSVQYVQVTGPGGGPVELEVTDARERLAGRVASIASRIGTPRGNPRLN